MMFDEVLLHPQTEAKLSDFLKQPSHAVLFEGVSNIGKSLVAHRVAARLLAVSFDELSTTPMFMHVQGNEKGIIIEQIRKISAFISLIVPGKNATKRVVVIEDAEKMTIPAQNSLLKILEEPPDDTIIILTSSLPHKLLQTILSRVNRVHFVKPSEEDTRKFLSVNHSEQDIEQSYFIAEGKVGSIISLVTTTSEQQTFTLADVRSFLKLSMFDQLLKIEQDFKDKKVAKQFVELLAIVAAKSLLKTSGTPAEEQWRRISQATYTAVNALGKNANSKLVLLELVLSLR